jgi:hypothetical protein
LPRIAEDLFALGSAIFEVTEWKLPHHDVNEDEVEVLMGQDILPEPSTDNPAASIIRKCWQEQYQSAAETVEELKGVQQALKGEEAN